MSLISVPITKLVSIRPRPSEDEPIVQDLLTIFREGATPEPPLVIEDFFVIDGMNRLEAWRALGNTDITVHYTNEFGEMLNYLQATSTKFGIPIPTRILEIYRDLADIGSRWSGQQRAKRATGRTKKEIAEEARYGRPYITSSREAFMNAICLNTRSVWWLGDFMDVANIVDRSPKQVRPYAQRLFRLLDTGLIGPAGIRNAVKELEECSTPAEWEKIVVTRVNLVNRRQQIAQEREQKAKAQTQLRDSTVGSTPLSQLVASFEGISHAAKDIEIPDGTSVKQAEILSMRLFAARREIGRLITRLNKIRKA